MTAAQHPSARALIEEARARLRGQPRDVLGDWAASRRLLGLGRAPRIVAVGEAWHVGVLLISDDSLFATGEVLRSREDAVRGFTAQSQRERAERAAAAFRGGIAEGRTVHLGWSELDLETVDAGGASGPLLGRVDGGGAQIRWNALGGVRDLAAYLDEQLSLRP